METASLALSMDFLTAFAGLPAAQQKGIRSLISKFESNPDLPGLNYERIKSAKNCKMISLRVDQDYRAIVLAPTKGNTHLLLWADKHNEAYRWAKKHDVMVNPETGGIQIFQPEPVTLPQQGTSPPANLRTGAFASLRNRQLMRLGVPKAMLGDIRTIRGEADLEAKKDRLPDEAYEGLFLYLAGEPYEKILKDREEPGKHVDPDDFDKALVRKESQSRFVLVHDEMELEKMLSAPLERWRVFLHPTQRQLVERDWSGPVRVLGAAGTGKTVVAMHRARWLARQPGAKKILFVTFNRNLAMDIDQNMAKICTPAEKSQVEVINLDRWVGEFLKRRKYEFRIVYGRSGPAWKKALATKPADLKFPEQFYETEWEHVVQANNIATRDEYKRVSRAGRGTPLSRAKRIKVWRVFEEYRLQLLLEGYKEVSDAYLDVMGLIESEQSQQSGSVYSSIVVDEAQDLRPQAFRLLRSLVPEGRNDMFIAGDCHQRIYGRQTVLGRCGINIRGRSRKLKLNYRTTEETRAWAAGMLEGRPIDDLDGGTDNNDGIRSLTTGPEPQVRSFKTRWDQTDGIVGYLKETHESGESISNVCVVARTTLERNVIGEGLETAGMPVVMLEKNPDDRSVSGVRLATMHRVKGLEFDRVVIASANANLMPLKSMMRRAADGAEQETVETMERSLVYVAASRAKKELVVMSYGKPSPFVRTAGTAK